MTISDPKDAAVDGAGQGDARALPDLSPGTTFAGYRIEALLDRGGMGVVYRATDLDLDRAIALKIIAPEHTTNQVAVARFKAEARLAASLEHPNIVPIFRGGEHEGVLYLAMRLIAGTNLRHVIDRGPLDLGRVARIAGQVADALDAAHARGLVHRDVKPANILVAGDDPREHVSLTDFGLTKRLGSVGDLTRPGGWVGTPDYVAPEQIQDHEIDRRSDIYSLGCVVYEMLTGRVAYPKESHMAKLWAHVTDPPPRPSAARPDLDPAFDAVVTTATAKDPGDRYPTAGALAEAVGAAVAGQEARRRHAAAQETGASGERPVLVAPTRDGVFAGTGAERSADAAPPERLVAASAVAAGVGGGSPPAPVIRDGRESSMRWLRRRRGAVAAILTLAAAAVVAAVVLTDGPGARHAAADATPAPTPAGRLAAARLNPVPTNHVRGDGDISIRLVGDRATLTVSSAGLVSQPHAMHIHEGGKGMCPPASAARDHDGNLAIDTLDGAPYYGKPVASLTTRGDSSAKSFLAFGRFPSTGAIRYRRTLDLDPVVVAGIKADTAVLIVHGIDYNHNGLYDNSSLARSDLDRSLPAEATAPALCGELRLRPQPKTESRTRTADDGVTYVASMSPLAATDGARTSGMAGMEATDGASGGSQRPARSPFPGFICDLRGVTSRL